MIHEYYNTLLISPGELKGESLINANVDDKPLSVIVQTNQEIYLCKIIGSALFRKLQELVYNKVNGLTPAIDGNGYEVYNELLEDYVKPYLKYKAVKSFLVENTFKLRNIGVARMIDTNVMTNDLDTLKYLEHHYESYVSAYEDRLSKFICANRDALPEVTAEVMSYLDEPQIGETYANTGGLWLGLGSKNNMRCNGCNGK